METPCKRLWMRDPPNTLKVFCLASLLEASCLASDSGDPLVLLLIVVVRGGEHAKGPRCPGPSQRLQRLAGVDSLVAIETSHVVFINARLACMLVSSTAAKATPRQLGKKRREGANRSLDGPIRANHFRVPELNPLFANRVLGH